MVDRIDLIGALADRVRFTATEGVKFNKALESALVMMIAALPLPSAQALKHSDRDALEDTLDNILTIADLKKVSKVWEPKRTIGSGETQTELADMLISLLRGEREPYSPITLSLGAARALSRSEKEIVSQTILNFAPDADLPKLLKKWDKNLVGLARMAPDEQATHLNNLLTGRAEPTPAPPKASKAKR